MTTGRVLSARFIRRRLRPLIRRHVVMRPHAIRLLRPRGRTVMVIFHLSNPELIRSTNNGDPLPRVYRRLRSEARNVGILLTPRQRLVMAHRNVQVLPRIRVGHPFLQFQRHAIRCLSFGQRFRNLGVLSERHRHAFVLSKTYVDECPCVRPRQLHATHLGFACPRGVGRVNRRKEVPLYLVLAETAAPASVLIRFVHRCVACGVHVRNQNKGCQEAILRFASDGFHSFRFFLHPGRDLYVRALSFPDLRPRHADDFRIKRVRFLMARVHHSPAGPGQDDRLAPRFVPIIQLHINRFCVVSR